MKTSRYSTAGGGMLPRMSDSPPLSLSRSCCHSVSPRPPLPFSLPPRQLLPSSPPLEAQLTSVATERCASRRAWFYARFDIYAAEYPAFVYLSDTQFFKKNPYSFKFFLHNSHFEEKIFPGQGFPIHMWKLTTSNRYFTFRTIPRGEDLLFNNADFFDFESSQWKPITLMKMIQDTSDKLAWFWWIFELTVRPLKKHLQANYREKICLTNRLL